MTIKMESIPNKLEHLSNSALPSLTPAGSKKRYEEIWSEDIHAVFMEAVAIYPPMGKKRVKYRRVLDDQTNSMDAKLSDVKSFGRCQLIQSYILEKTGQVRTRKQVSSHLQRFKKIHKHNPSSLSIDLIAETRAANPVPVRNLFTESMSLQENTSPPSKVPDKPVKKQKTRPKPQIFDGTYPPLGDNSCGYSLYSDYTISSSNKKQKREVISADNTLLSFDHDEAISTYLSSKQDLMCRSVDFTRTYDFDGGRPHPKNTEIPSFLANTEPNNANSALSNFCISMRRLSSKLPDIYRQAENSSFYASQDLYSSGCDNSHRVVSYDGPDFLPTDISCSYSLPPPESKSHALPLPHLSPYEKADTGYPHPVPCWNMHSPSEASLDTPDPSFGSSTYCTFDSSAEGFAPAISEESISLCSDSDDRRPSSHPNTSLHLDVAESLRFSGRWPYPDPSCPVTSLVPASFGGLSSGPAIEQPNMSHFWFNDRMEPPFILKPTPLYPTTYTHPSP
ncbi:TEA/ATTS domain family-domain-containing protein [Hygrophoropsis aurantiaca]|uniref:TEA/ATTS domain family-domain-containing protein n=1 Tax=Hygrophoropsis aurantiaca TaxID=72124 RepID=A0ACB8ASS5_9AGAM|nr:TEA/ATTS domain family-domain-containing protein [Hygrophoropsis aurantiaca]